MKRVLGAVVGLLAALIIGSVTNGSERCDRVYWQLGIELPVCPSGTMRQRANLQVNGVRRGAVATVNLAVIADYTIDAADAVQHARLPEVERVALSLVDAAGKATPLPIEKRVSRNVFEIKVPETPDGDYKLRATYATKLGDGEVEAPIALYAPARIHVVTDRPLYEPGNTVRFRAVVLRARDLAPLDGRPGRWVVTDPTGEVMLEEKAPASDWGVVAGAFPIDKLAPTGTWKVAWTSATATDEITFKVEPFKLPRFRVEASPDQPFYQAGGTPVVRGAVVYSSGAPVANAALEIFWSVDGTWPPPTEWEESLLPKKATTGANGRFELALPVIPKDLQGQVTLAATISAVDKAGDRVEGRTQVLLAQDGISASAVTELGNGLVESFNNRMYVRVTTPDGQVVRNTKIHVTRAWQPSDPGIDAQLDEDGVASLQIDPGAPVNIVIPALPYRPTKKTPTVTREEPEELFGDDGASLGDQVEMDRWLPALVPCAKWYASGDSEGVMVGMRVEASGAIATVGTAPGPLGTCVANVLRGKRLPAGKERLYTIGFNFEDPELPSVSHDIVSAFDGPEGLGVTITERLQGARDCLPRVAGELPRALSWRVKAGAKAVELGPWVARDVESGAAPALACVQARVGTRIALDEAAASDALGYITFTVTPPEAEIDERPQATTMLGYELLVTAELPGTPSTKLRLEPGVVPNLRMRVSPNLPTVGGTLTAELIRGPEFTGELPKELVLTHLKGEAKVKLDDKRTAVFEVTPDIAGWVQITGGGVTALAYVRPATDLSVSVEPQQPRYKPGDQAQLVIQTRIGGQGAQAAVGLFGVDDSLGQISTLDGVDSMSRVQPHVSTSTPAFGVLDGQALTLGRIRGANAAAATVLRVSSIPAAAELDAEVSAFASTRFDPLEELTDNFYTVLAELHLQVRRWEATAPKDEKMTPPTMASLWKASLAACEARGERVVDAYGRKLRLAMLPQDLLALTAPRAVIVQGTRLDEDTENWANWVAKERP